MKVIPLVVLVLSIAVIADAKPLEKRMWQLHDYNMAHIQRLIELTATYGITEIQLSHNIVMDADQVLENEKLAADISAVCDYAHKRGVKVSIWTHELERVPGELRKDGKVNADDPKLWAWLTDKYNRVFSVCPDLDGLVLTFHETQVSIYHDSRVASSLSPPQRVGKLIDTLAAVCESKGKHLVVRSFCYQPGELQFIKDGFALAKSDFTVMSKCQPHDWQPYYPHNPLIGNVGGRPQIMEIDCGHEFLGQGEIPYIDAKYMRDRIAYGVSKGMVGAVARIERDGNHALDTPNWTNVHVFSKLLQDPSLDAEHLAEQYIAERYGKDAAVPVARALDRTFDIVNKTFFVRGSWLTDHSRIPSWGYAKGHLERNGPDKWDPDPKWAELKKRLMAPDTETLKEIRSEKDEALALCRKSIQDLEQARASLSPSDHDELISYFKREEAVVLTWRAYFDVFFGVLAYQASGKPEYRSHTETAIVDLVQCAEKYGEELRELTGDGGSDNVSRITEFVKEVRERLAKASVKTTSQ